MANGEIVKFYGIKETLAVMRTVEPEMLKQLRKDIRKISSPAVTAIKQTSPKISPFAGRRIDGMSHNGRTAYTPPKVSVSITPAQRSHGFGSTTANLAAIISTGSNKHIGFDIIDMAGRGGQASRYGMSREYTRNGKPTRHKLNGQGTALIANLPRRASRYVYPAIENKLPSIRDQVANSIEVASQELTRKLDKI